MKLNYRYIVRHSNIYNLLLVQGHNRKQIITAKCAKTPRVIIQHQYCRYEWEDMYNVQKGHLDFYIYPYMQLNTQ